MAPVSNAVKDSGSITATWDDEDTKVTASTNSRKKETTTEK